MAKGIFAIALMVLITVGGYVAPAWSASFPLAAASGGGSLFNFSGQRPSQLGVQDGKFLACPSSPNCVSSQASEGDPGHFIPPLTYLSSSQEAIATLKQIIQSMERTTIVDESDTYLYAEFKSALMGFVDDVEFYAEPETGIIQVRSASRLGESDLGVNRQRIEAIRAALASAQS